MVAKMKTGQLDGAVLSIPSGLFGHLQERARAAAPGPPHPVEHAGIASATRSRPRFKKGMLMPGSPC